jgi:hypothetical protein
MLLAIKPEENRLLRRSGYRLVDNIKVDHRRRRWEWGY